MTDSVVSCSSMDEQVWLSLFSRRRFNSIQTVMNSLLHNMCEKNKGVLYKIINASFVTSRFSFLFYQTLAVSLLSGQERETHSQIWFLSLFVNKPFIQLI